MHKPKQNTFPNFPQEIDKRHSETASSLASSAAFPRMPEVQVPVAFRLEDRISVCVICGEEHKHQLIDQARA